MTREGDAGFTLLETIVALVVFALVSAGVQSCLTGSWRGVRIVAQEQQALDIAKSQMAAVGVETALAEGVEEGTAGSGFVWTREVRPYDGTRNSAIVAGYWVTVAVRWSEGPRRGERTVALTTLKLGRVQP